MSQAFDALVLLCLEVDAVLEHHTDALPFSGEGIYNHSPHDLLVKDVIRRCHTIHSQAGGIDAFRPTILSHPKVTLPGKEYLERCQIDIYVISQ